MEKLINVIVFIFFMNNTLFSQNTINFIFYQLPCEKTNFKVIGIYQSDSLLVIKRLYYVNYLYYTLKPKKVLCESYYLISEKNIGIAKKNKISTKSSNKLLRLMYSPIAKYGLVNYNEYFPNFGLKDSLLKNLLNNNAIYEDIPPITNLYDSIQDMNNLESNSQYYSVRKLINVNTFLIVEMNLFEFYQNLYTRCVCKDNSFSEYPFKIRHKHQLIRVAIPIDKNSVEKYSNDLKKYIIDYPGLN